MQCAVLPPNRFTCLAHCFYNAMMSGDFSSAELKILLTILRQTVGYTFKKPKRCRVKYGIARRWFISTCRLTKTPIEEALKRLQLRKAIIKHPRRLKWDEWSVNMDTSEWILDINSLKKEPLKRGRFFILKSGKRGHFSHLIKGNIKEKDISKRRNERNTGTTSQAIYSEIVNSMLGEYRKAFHHHFKEYPDKARTRDCLRAFRKIVKENYALLVDSDKGDVSVFPKTVEHWMRYNLHPSRDLYPKQYPPWWLYKDFQVIRSDYERQKDYVPFPEIKENVK